MDEASSSGPIKVHMKETFFKIISMEKANTDGLMDEFTTASGLITRWKARAPSHGAMAVDTLAATRTIRSMATARSSGPTVANILANGVKASNTGKVSTSKKAKSGKESGKWARGLSGSRPRRLQRTARSSES